MSTTLNGNHRLPREERERVRDFLRELRANDPTMTARKGRQHAERQFGVQFGTSFSATYWQQSEPEQVEEETQPEESFSGIRVDEYDDGTARLCVDLMMPTAKAYSAAAAISLALAEQKGA